MTLYTAKVNIKGTRPFILDRKNTFNTTEEGQLYIDSSYIHRCLIKAAKFTKRGLQVHLAATLEIADERLLL